MASGRIIEVIVQSPHKIGYFPTKFGEAALIYPHHSYCKASFMPVQALAFPGMALST
jgi:hypothetical protein